MSDASPQISGPTASDAHESDPTIHGWMEGFPPAPDKSITFADGSFRQFPQLRWAWSNIRQLVPTVNVWRGSGAVSALPRGDQDLSSIALSTTEGRSMILDQALVETYTDGIIVLHRGSVIFERYFGALVPHKPHIAMSVTKSFTGTLAGILIADGMLDPDAPTTDYVPEFRGSGFGDATVRQVMDMTTGLDFREVQKDLTSGVWALRRANGMAPLEPGQAPTSLLDYLTTVGKEGEHGQVFKYRTVNTDALAWILRRASGQSLSDLLSEKIWRHIGAEEDAYFHVDRLGIESAGGGLSTTLRDLARFGEVMRRRGTIDGKRVFPTIVTDEIAAGGDPVKFASAGYTQLSGWSYRNQWWIGHGIYMARGIHGQSIYIDPAREVTIARFASHPDPRNLVNDPITLPAYKRIADELADNG